jgi:hypothetical protein
MKQPANTSLVDLAKALGSRPPANGGGGEEGAGSTVSAEVREVLKDTVLISPAPNVEWTGLPAGYDYFELQISARGDGSGAQEAIEISFNGDTTASNYSSIDAYTINGGGWNMGIFPDFGSALVSNGQVAGNFAELHGRIADPANTTKNKILHITAGLINMLDWRVTTWKNIAAISSIKFTPGTSENFVAGSKFRLVGSRLRNVVYAG